ncbi:MAG: hypothetical protein C0394_09555 [Syntrophus sp. (in: bacteria)]|nr:hypothetical protein [Syntrophus sp. (in: bacteria)]
MGKLRDQMLADLQLCGAKPRTQVSYLREAENLARYFNRSPAELGEAELKEYLLYCKPPFDGPKGVLQYLGRYTHRIAISNNRILAIRDGKVSFLWRDYADGNRKKTMTLKADEFIRRFLLHVLPERYVRIRHFGLLANRNRKNNIVLCRKILGDCNAATKEKVMCHPRDKMNPFVY